MSQSVDKSAVQMARIFASFLKSISKLLVRNNISYQTASETLKQALVQSVIENEAATDSLVSLKTGVHRKDVKRIRAEDASESLPKIPIRGLAMVLATWSGNEKFLESDGEPRPLSRKGPQGFDEMVKASKVDLAPATVLSELLTQGLVERLPDQSFKLLSKTVLGQSDEAKLDAFEATLSDHTRVAAENVLAPHGQSRHFDRVLRYSHLSANSVQTLEAEARKLAQNYLEHLNVLAHRLQSEDDAAGTLANGRFVTGTFIAPTQPNADQKLSVTDEKKDDP